MQAIGVIECRKREREREKRAENKERKAEKKEIQKRHVFDVI